MVVALLHSILFQREQASVWGRHTDRSGEEDEVDENRTPLLARASEVS
jgi:hypothetical protein